MERGEVKAPPTLRGLTLKQVVLSNRVNSGIELPLFERTPWTTSMNNFRCTLPARQKVSSSFQKSRGRWWAHKHLLFLILRFGTSPCLQFTHDRTAHSERTCRDLVHRQNTFQRDPNTLFPQELVTMEPIVTVAIRSEIHQRADPIVLRNPPAIYIITNHFQNPSTTQLVGVPSL